jgi:hypothetical protein
MNQPRDLRRIAATLAEENAPIESEMRREGMLYRYLRDYTPNSPMNSPLDALPYDNDPDDDIIDTQPWWDDQTTSTRRESSPSVDPMDTSVMNTRGVSAPPQAMPTPEHTPYRHPSTTSLTGSDIIPSSPNTMTAMPPPMIPQLARMKRKGMFL